MSDWEWCGSTGTDTSPNPGWDGPQWRVVPDTGLGHEEWDPTMTADEERAWYSNMSLNTKRCDYTTGQHRHRSDDPCSGLDQRDPEALLFGLVGGPGALGLPTPVDDLRTETRAVGW